MGGGLTGRLGNGVIAEAAPRVTASEAPKAEHPAAEGAVPFDRFESVSRAGRLVPAGRQTASAGPHETVGPDPGPEETGGGTHEPAAESSSLTAVSSSSKVAAAAAGEAPRR